MGRRAACYKVTMTPDERLPVACFQDAVARIAADGELTPCNPQMDAWLGAFGRRMGDLRMDEEDREALTDGAPVVVRGVRMDGVGVHWELRRNVVDGEAWLTARDVTDRERRAATLLASLRSRGLGEIAGSLAHDMNNQLNSALALCAELSFLATEEEDVQSIRAVEQGTKIGATAFGALARMLARTPARRERVAVADLVDECTALVRKFLQQQGVQLTVTTADSLPSVRIVLADVVHALTSLLRKISELAPASVEITSQLRPLEGRSRGAVVVRVCVRGVDQDQAAAWARVARIEAGSLHELASNAGLGQDLPVAVFLLRRFGGDLTTESAGDQLTLAFSMPAAR